MGLCVCVCVYYYVLDCYGGGNNWNTAPLGFHKGSILD